MKVCVCVCWGCDTLRLLKSGKGIGRRKEGRLLERIINSWTDRFLMFKSITVCLPDTLFMLRKH